MQRTANIFLNEWLNSSTRKPLVIRGARQVGKTWLVRNFAQIHKKNLIELNLEKRPQLASFFSSNNPAQILLNLGAALNMSIDPKDSLLFLDEIQATPDLFAKLRWFAEDMPELPVIAAGSLLEFVLEEHTFSMPVGRINYMHLEPLSFQEFLIAKGLQRLSDYLKSYTLDIQIPIAIHEQLMNLFKEYIIIGGMPQAVSSWANNQSLKEVNQIHYDLMATYRDDFSKYSGRLSIERLDEVIRAIPKMLGQKFVYTTVNPLVQAPAIKKALDLLCKARVCHKVMATDANGIPLEAEINEKFFKAIFLDTGLACAALGLTLDLIYQTEDIELINSGGIAEQVTGQLLRTIEPLYKEPALYCWYRTEKQSNAEIDYIVQHKNIAIPVEVKAGSTGSLKSLHLFMGLKKLHKAVRFNADTASMATVNTKDLSGNLVQFRLISLPFYLISEMHRLV